MQEALGLREVPIGWNAYLLHFRRWAGSDRRRGRQPALPPAAGACSCSHMTWTTRSIRRRLGMPSPSRWPTSASAASPFARPRTAQRQPCWPRCVIVRRSKREAPPVRGSDGCRGRAGLTGVLLRRRVCARSSTRKAGGRTSATTCAVAPQCPGKSRSVVDRGFGVRLHVGYGALADVRRIAAERERLEAVAGAPVRGSRHHYWHMTRPFWDSLDAHASAGLAFDSSVAFNSAPGFRLGVALPFQPWNPQEASSDSRTPGAAHAGDGQHVHARQRSRRRSRRGGGCGTGRRLEALRKAWLRSTGTSTPRFRLQALRPLGESVPRPTRRPCGRPGVSVGRSTNSSRQLQPRQSRRPCRQRALDEIRPASPTCMRRLAPVT